ncbi:hypothetical protein LSH36_473g03032 [Paralvinella palmiformis]|uniref:Uncharacterized protein n=1 Tax=Paralvinella palmiformis TaxID=53620 RepID=A0AAD9J9I7_9ANNE|nr:hypothetical protein LSH36_473g03032 [Paralvinella palmiformis]
MTETIIFKIGITITEIEATITKIMAIITKIETTITKTDAIITEIETAITKIEVIITKIMEIITKIEITITKHETIITEIETTITKIEKWDKTAVGGFLQAPSFPVVVVVIVVIVVVVVVDISIAVIVFFENGILWAGIYFQKKLIGFFDLVKKVNYWLCQNPQIEAKTCEMITWSTPHVSRVGDSESMIQEQHNQFMIINDTYYVMGLRVWIVPQTGTGATQIINYRDFKPEDNESLSELLEKTNSSLDDDTLQGHVLCFETVMLPNFRSSDTNSLFWRENENVSRGFTAFLRLFYVEGPKTCYRLGIRNIVPDVIQGNYEPFSCLMRRASQWVSSEPSVKVTNLRSTYVTRDNDSPSQAADRCDQYFRDFAKEQYFQIIRIYHVSSPSFSTTKHVINCMTFTPVQSSIGPSTEATFETMKSTMLRIDAWIRLSGAKIFSLESLITPMIPTQPNHTLPEMTHWLPKRAATTDNGRKKFLLHIRIYIDGEFIDPDPRLLPPLPYSLTKQLESSLEEKELKRFYKKKKMRKTQNRIAIAMFMFILVTVALVIIIERMLKRYYR